MPQLLATQQRSTELHDKLFAKLPDLNFSVVVLLKMPKWKDFFENGQLSDSRVANTNSNKIEPIDHAIT